MSVQLTRTRWRAIVETVRLGPRSYRVVRPADNLSGAHLRETAWYGFDMHVDQPAALDLAMAWGLVIRSPRTLIYLPMNRSRDRDADGSPAFDLVLLHHSLAFAPSLWKQIRARLGTGTPLRVTLPSRTFEARPRSEYQRHSHAGYHDFLRWGIAAETLFLVGSGQAFRLEADQIRGLAENGPAFVASRTNSHYCVEIGVGRPWRGYAHKRHRWSELHIVYAPHPDLPAP